MRVACWGALAVLSAHEARGQWPSIVQGAEPYLRRMCQPPVATELDEGRMEVGAKAELSLLTGASEE